MNRLLLLLGILGFVVATPAEELVIRVVDYPEEVMLYWPIPITVEVRNIGDEPVVLPVGPRNPFVMTGTSPKSMTIYRPVDLFASGSLHLLDPGEARLWQFDLAPYWSYAPGELLAISGVESSGECAYYRTGQETFPLEQVRQEGTLSWYKCWAGRAESSTVFIKIVEPESGIEREALDYLLSPEFPSRVPLGIRMQSASRALQEQFPASEYAFVSAVYRCGQDADCYTKQIGKRPEHPFARQLRLRQALALLDSGVEVSNAYVQDSGLPEPLQAYLRQRRDASREPVAPDQSRDQPQE